jgi:general secretion pathway protein G
MFMMINKIKKQEGFTLIELLIVIVILGILAAVGIPKFLANKEMAWAKTCRANRASLDDAAERYFFDNNAYPTAGQSALLSAPVGVTATWKGPYIKAGFECPATNTSTVYTINGSGVTSCDNMTGASPLHSDGRD